MKQQSSVKWDLTTIQPIWLLVHEAFIGALFCVTELHDWSAWKKIVLFLF